MSTSYVPTATPGVEMAKILLGQLASHADSGQIISATVNGTLLASYVGGPAPDWVGKLAEHVFEAPESVRALVPRVPHVLVITNMSVYLAREDERVGYSLSRLAVW